MQFHNCHLVEVESGEVHEGAVITVEGGYISSITTGAAATDTDPSKTTDMRGLYVLPGLWDTHSHPGIQGPVDIVADEQRRVEAVRRSVLEAQRYGVVGVRALGEALFADAKVRDEFSSEEPPLMLLEVAGPALKPTGGHGYVTPPKSLAGDVLLSDAWGSCEVDTPREIAEAVRSHVQNHRVNWIKIFASGGIAGENERYDQTHMSLEQISAVCDAAARLKVPVAAHAGNPEAIERSILGGVTSIEHGYELSIANAQMMEDRGVWYVPTMSITHNTSRMELMGWSANTIDKAVALQETHRTSLENARNAGVKIAIGSDMRPAGRASVEELLIFKDLGVPIPEILRMATLNAARMCQREAISGSLSVGKRADMIFVRDNPFNILETILSPEVVINVGQRIDEQHRSS